MLHDIYCATEGRPVSAPIDVGADDGYFSNLTKLATGQYIFKYSGYNCDDFKIFLLNKKEQANGAFQFELEGKIEPLKEHSIDSHGSGDFAALPNGDILTYHRSGRNFQVWQDTKCIKKWGWWLNEQIKLSCSDETYKKGFWTRKMIPLPDNEHVLVLVWGVKLFLFSLKTNLLTPVDIGNHYPYNVSVRTNGQVLVQTSQDHTNNNLLLLEFKEMLAYRTLIFKALEAKNLPTELNALITSFLAPDSSWTIEEEKEPSRCSVM
ncbi:hypothetical protein B1207_06340 [Legionella quinlivanii]|uniref:Uncharacterized protein n=1 Tax=Legionella quinlivanii TaxID=45073 RepID=A0A364LKB1_9GAMM|nr:hypothetical protein [Legionella quinlivanii]RAP37038.1 hypothetical protein B1207_06340 [Legionella quinlivanii]